LSVDLCLTQPEASSQNGASVAGLALSQTTATTGPVSR
jgi:hypothetical protein